MGSSSSKFRKHLQNGDEYAALHVYNHHSDLRKALDPNSSYGDTYNHDTPLHFASRHAMKSLLRIFLTEHHGNPNKTNAQDETSLHCVCGTVNSQTYTQHQRRLDCLQLLLQWRGASPGTEELERINLSALDKNDDTALHKAATSGLRRCVEVLVAQGAPLFVENQQKLTPCDCAEKAGHNSIAVYLESKMVFSEATDDGEDQDSSLDQIEAQEAYSGLRAQDLQEAKDQLLVETADMLRVPLFTAEALLRNHEWSRETLLEAWMDDPVACCNQCGVNPPAHLVPGQSEPQVPSNLTSDPSNQGSVSGAVYQGAESNLVTSGNAQSAGSHFICDICTCSTDDLRDPYKMTCEHQFCRDCWKRYLTGKIEEGAAHSITCPAYNCDKLVPIETIEKLVSKDMARRYLQFDIKAFVESHPSIKWCPYPACGRAVRLPDSDNPLSPTFQDPMGSINADFSRAVDCGSGHLFCWECLGEAHEPASCQSWTTWHKKIGEIKPEELSNTEEDSELAANCLWLVTNSKACPNCKSPIQKNEGCNHMKCSKCKHDFCWVCLESWKKHSSATGGYFRCNRYEVVRVVEDGTEKLKAEAEEKNKKMQELNKFLHYYTRFKNHENSYKLELPLVSSAKEKMQILAREGVERNQASAETKFVEDAVLQLLKARRVLKCSYVYGFYLDDSGYKKPIFEFMQTELEECGETLSEMVARPYLRTPRHKIIQTAKLVQRKRHELVSAIAKGLVPADTSPATKKKRKKYELDEDLKKALLASASTEQGKAWIKDKNGRHTNLTAVLDWPEESDEESGGEESEGGVIGKCQRKNCKKQRAQNPRTGEYHNHCSMKCLRLDQYKQKNEDTEAGEYFNDYELELLRALEMSRLQFLKEMGQLRPGTESSLSPRTPGRSPGGPNVLINHPSEEDTPIVLQDPPRGRGQQRSASPNPSSTVGFDPELQRALELSRRSYQEEERELRRAMEISLRDRPSSSSHSNDHQRCSSATCCSSGCATLAPPGGMTPVGSLEAAVSSSPHLLTPTTCAASRCSGFDQSARVIEVSQQRYAHPPKNTNDNAFPSCGRTHAATHSKAPNTFGCIKDLSVANIVAKDNNKTENFESKDLSHFYLKSAPNDTNDVTSDQWVPLSSSSQENNIWVDQGNGVGFAYSPLSRGQREFSSFTAPRSPRADASGHCTLPASYCSLGAGTSGLKSSCPLASSYTRSPRDAIGGGFHMSRDRRSFSGYEFDHLAEEKMAPGFHETHLSVDGESSHHQRQRRCTSWSDGPPTLHPDQPRLSGARPYSERDLLPANDPGPCLDAVLRSLSKMTARLSDEEARIPGYVCCPHTQQFESGINTNIAIHCQHQHVTDPHLRASLPTDGQGGEVLVLEQPDPPPADESYQHDRDNEKDDDAVFV